MGFEPDAVISHHCAIRRCGFIEPKKRFVSPRSAFAEHSDLSKEGTKSRFGLEPVSALTSVRTTFSLPDAICEVGDLFRGRLQLIGSRHKSAGTVKTCVVQGYDSEGKGGKPE
jgi:hypothetical protein